MGKNGFLSRVDLTLLDANATPKDFANMAQDACKMGTRAVCVPMGGISVCKDEIEKWTSHNAMNPHTVKICSVIDFPDGALDPESRLMLAERAMKLGAKELDVVMPIGKFLADKFVRVPSEINGLILETHRRNVSVKLIFETGYLSDEFILRSAEFAYAYHFMWKTSTGRDPKVAIPEKARHVRLVREAFRKLKIKAAGGIRTQEDVKMLYDAGADIFGISWKSVKEIVENWK